MWMFATCLTGTCEHFRSFMDEGLASASGFSGKDVVVKISLAEWKSVKDCVDTNGYCRIAGQSVVIVVTNGLPNVEVIHWFPMGRGPEKLKKHSQEPESYPNQ